MEVDLPKPMKDLTNLQRGRYVALKVIKFLKSMHNELEFWIFLKYSTCPWVYLFRLVRRYLRG